MSRPRFHLWHSVLGTVVLVLIEIACLQTSTPVALTVLLVLAAVGAGVTIFASTEAVEEVRGSRALFIMLTLVIIQFVLYFAFEYWLLDMLQPAAYPTLGNGPTDYLLASLMVFVLNPVNLPATAAGQLLLIIETVGAIGVVVFVLQNISQLRRKSLDTHS